MARTKKAPHPKERTKSGKSKDLVNRPKKSRIGREIKRYQKTTDLLIPRLPFSRLVRDILIDCSRDGYIRITKECLICLHTAAEIYLTTYFEDLNVLSQHAKRVTVMVKDIETLRALKRSAEHGHLN